MHAFPLLSTFRFRRAALVAVLAGVAGCQDSGGSPASLSESSSLLVTVTPAKRTEGYTQAREFLGRVEATRASELGFEIGGELEAVTVDEGDVIAEGALLARLDTARLEARLAEARAALEEARSASELARRTLARNEEAFEFEGVSAQELDLARDQAAAAESRVAAAGARVNAVEVDLAKARLLAPYDAVVVARRIDEGNVVAAGQPVLRLQEEAPPEARIGVTGGLAGTLEAGQSRPISIDGRRFEARVRAVLPVRDPRTRTVDVILSLPGDAGAVPGDIARLTVEETVDEPGFWLPADALAEGSRGLWTAYVAMPLDAGRLPATGATHQLEPRTVEVLHQDGPDVYVRGALSTGDRVASGGLQRVVPYQEVRIEEPAAVAKRGGARP